MDIWAFDPASACGVAMGAPPNKLSDLNSGVWGLRTKTGMDPDEVAIAFYAQLRRHRDVYAKLDRPQPDLIVYEKPLPLAASLEHRDGRVRNEASLVLPQKLQFALRLFAATYGIRCEGIMDSSWRAAFCGGRPTRTAQESASEAGKRLTVENCRRYGYVPEDCNDHDRCDAIGIWHVAQVRHARWQPPVEVLFGKRLAVAG